MAAKMSVLGLILSFYPYLRSAMIRFPLIFPIYRAPQNTLHDKKGHLQVVTKLPKRWIWKYFFLLLLGFLLNWITTRRDMSYPCPKGKYCRSYFLGKFSTRHSLHCSFLKRPSLVSWINSSFSLVILDTCQSRMLRSVNRAQRSVWYAPFWRLKLTANGGKWRG